MKTIGFLISAFFLLQLCNEKQDCYSQIPGNDILFEFSVVNQNGEDLIAKNAQNSYNTDNIKLYNLINNEKKLINNPNSDSPNGYIVFEKNGLSLMRTSFDESSLTVNGIIEWNPNERDTISLEMVQESENVKRLVKIKYNDEIVWNEETVSNPDNRYFQIVK